jgi:hypothetical protein
MPRGWEAAHVEANLGDDDLPAKITQAWMGTQQTDRLTKRVEVTVHLCVNLGNGRIEPVNLAQVQAQQEAMLAGDPPL